MELHGKYDSPLIGVTKNPAGVHGPGALHVLPEGLRVVAARNPTGLMSGFGCLGIVVGTVLAVVLGALTHDYAVPDGLAKGVGTGLFFGGLFAGLLLGKKLGKARPLDVLLPWAAVRADEVVGLTLSFQSKAKPKGLIYFQHPDTEALKRVDATIRAGGMVRP